MITRAELESLVASDDAPGTYRLTSDAYAMERALATIRQHERQEPRKRLHVIEARGPFGQ
ncbi:MAG: hypothetical protein ACXVHB_06075 [Solirubrobacteraceae bacterium]